MLKKILIFLILCLVTNNLYSLELTYYKLKKELFLSPSGLGVRGIAKSVDEDTVILTKLIDLLNKEDRVMNDELQKEMFFIFNAVNIINPIKEYKDIILGYLDNFQKCNVKERVFYKATMDLYIRAFTYYFEKEGESKMVAKNLGKLASMKFSHSPEVRRKIEQKYRDLLNKKMITTGVIAGYMQILQDKGDTEGITELYNRYYSKLSSEEFKKNRIVQIVRKAENASKKESKTIRKRFLSDKRLDLSSFKKSPNWIKDEILNIILNQEDMKDNRIKEEAFKKLNHYKYLTERDSFVKLSPSAKKFMKMYKKMKR